MTTLLLAESYTAEIKLVASEFSNTEGKLKSIDVPLTVPTIAVP